MPEHTSARSADDRLDTLFRCEHFGKQLAVRHCLRRQNERKQTKHPKTMKLVAGEPEHGFCATACAQGRAIRAELADVPAGHCERCGTAYVGAAAAATPCEECAFARQEERGAGPAHGFLKAAKSDVSTRIWAKDAPDAPIGPPAETARRGVGLSAARVADAAARVREAARHPTRVATPPGANEKRVDAQEVASHATSPGKPGAKPAQPAPVTTQHQPAMPAEETTMARGGVHPPCGECQSTGRHRKTCSKAKRNASVAPVKPAKKPNTPRGTKPARKGTRVTVKVVDSTDIDELLERREDLEAELSAVDAAIQEALAAEKAKVERLEAAVERARTRKAA